MEFFGYKEEIVGGLVKEKEDRQTSIGQFIKGISKWYSRRKKIESPTAGNFN